MNLKKCILTIMGFLYFTMHSMERPNEVANNYIVVGTALLPRKFRNDVFLNNITYCPKTKKFIMLSENLQETLMCRSLFPSLVDTRSYNNLWSFVGVGNYRHVLVQQKDLTLLEEINKTAIFDEKQ